MGIFQLTSPVLMLSFSLVGAGMQTAISKFTAAYINCKQRRAQLYLFCGTLLAFSISALYGLVVFIFSETIASSLLQEPACAPLLRICALSFPLSTMHCCFNGYFYGTKNTKLPSFVQITEQIVRVGSVLILYFYYIFQGKTPTIAITCIGMLLGEACALTISLFYYFQHCLTKEILTGINSQSDKITFSHLKEITGQLVSFSFPLTLNRVILNLLQSYEAISLPASLKKYGYSSDTALGIYGVLTGMALSFIMFPSTFTNSLAVLLLPTVSEAQSLNKRKSLQTIFSRTVIFALALGGFCTFVFYTLGEFFGNFLFQNTLAGRFIQILSFLCPFMYLRITLFSMLNGLQKTKLTLYINIFSITIRLFAILLAVPNLGIYAYLYTMLISEVLSALLGLYFMYKNSQ